MFILSNTLPKSMKERLDKKLYSQGLAKSRTHAQTLIKSGYVCVNGKTVLKTNSEVENDDALLVTKTSPYTSRGGEKLEHALSTWHIDLKNLIVLDVGSSTGGFTDCSLKHGAQHVYAVDVGTNQFDSELKKDTRITLLENTDIRTIPSLPEIPDIAVIDVSFISLSHIIKKTASLIKKKGVVIALIKPQFEIGPHVHKTKGVIKDTDLHQQAIEKVRSAITEADCEVVNITDSPILGGKGNKEFLVLFKKLS